MKGKTLFSSKRAHALIGSIPSGSTAPFVALAEAAGDRNQFHQVAKLVREHPDVAHRVVCVGKRPGEYFVPPRFHVAEGGLPVAVRRLRAERIGVNDGGCLLDTGGVLDAEALVSLLAESKDPAA